jgi:hypothetical protein
MSLGKLLATGRSLVGSHGDAHRFQINKRMALPKFISPKNPFASGAQQERAEARPPAASPTEAKIRASNAPATPAALRKLNPARAIQWVGAVGQKLNPLSLLKRAPRPVSAASKELPPHQPELSLDTVRVLRNDLSDSDEESPMKPAPKHTGVLAMSARAEVAMDKLSSKIFGNADA